MGEKDIAEKQGKKPTDGEERRRPPPLERKVSMAAADDSSESEKEEDEEGEDGAESGSGKEGGVNGNGNRDVIGVADSGSEKSAPPMTEYVVNVVSPNNIHSLSQLE